FVLSCSGMVHVVCDSLLCYADAIAFLFFFNDPATTEIYTLSLHDALPIYAGPGAARAGGGLAALGLHRRHGGGDRVPARLLAGRDRKSTRLNSSHVEISYAVFCLKKKKNTIIKIICTCT